MRVSFQPWGRSLDELIVAARAAEDAGADTVWLPELHRSSTVSAAAVGAATDHVCVATGIALAFARSPMILALEALDLAELTGGRFRLGLGSGTRRMNTEWHASEFDHPVERMADTIDAIRTFWRRSADGGRIETAGRLRPMRLAGYQRPLATWDIPIHLAAVGPRMLRLAGRVADGWLAHELCSPTYVRERALPELERGLAEAGRSRADLEITASAVCAVSGDRRTAAELVSGHVGFYGGVRAYADFFAFHDVLEEHEQIAAQLRAGAGAGNLSAAGRMREVLTVTGDRDDVLQRLTEYEGVADVVKVSPPVHALEPDQIRAAQTELIAVIAELRR